MAKGKTKAVSRKSVSSKKKRFGFKNLDFKKNWKKLSYLGLAGFLAVSSIGYGVFSTIKQDDADALAVATYGTHIPLISSSMYVCQYASKTGITSLRVKAFKKNSGTETYMLNTTGDDFYWSTPTNYVSNTRTLYNISVSSTVSYSIRNSNGSSVSGSNFPVRSLAWC